MRLVILGPPGSGKGTVASRLALELGVPHISVGEILREAERRGDALGRRIKSLIDKGNLVPASVANKVVERRLALPDAASGFILDGYPRELDEAEFLDGLVEIDAVILLDVPDRVVASRLAGRSQCPVDGQVYGPDIPPKRKGFCDKHGVKLVVRPDDTTAGIKRRLEVYHDVTEPLVEYYRPRKLVRTVDADAKPAKVIAAVRKALE